MFALQPAQWKTNESNRELACLSGIKMPADGPIQLRLQALWLL